MQGHLRPEVISVTVESECAHCHRSLHLEITSELAYRVVEEDASPLVYAPMVDLDKLDDPSIIDAF